MSSSLSLPGRGPGCGVSVLAPPAPFSATHGERRSRYLSRVSFPDGRAARGAVRFLLKEQHEVEIEIFGKQDCSRCEAAKKKVGFFLGKWGLNGQVPVAFIDVDTIDGRADGAFRDVGDVPTTIVLNDGAETGRWILDPPDSTDLRRALGLAP